MVFMLLRQINVLANLIKSDYLFLRWVEGSQIFPYIWTATWLAVSDRIKELENLYFCPEAFWDILTMLELISNL